MTLLVRPVLLLLICSVGGACSKNASPQAQGESAILPPEENARIESQLIPATSSRAGAPAQERLEGAIHPGLTMRLQMYIEKTGKIPENIYEFANTVVDSMPPAPAGMKYVIDPVDKAVKVVRK